MWYHDIFNNIRKFIETPKGMAITGSIFAGLVAAKVYFNGGVCRVDRPMEGEIIVITGANTGIGKETIKELSRRKCRIIFGARDESKSLEAVKVIQLFNKDAQVTFIKLDLADTNSIREFAGQVSTSCDRIDVLINNAGVMAIPDRRETQQGFEMQMGVNHLGHFYLTHLLWPKIKLANQARVINVSSTAHRGMGQPGKNFEFDISDLRFVKEPYNDRRAYSRSKVSNILFTKELQRRLSEAGSNAVTVSLHPGVVRTELARHLNWKVVLTVLTLYPLFYLITKNAWQGAQTTLYTVLEQADKLEKGAYYTDCKVHPSSQFSCNPEKAKELWQASEEILGIKFDV